MQVVSVERRIAAPIDEVWRHYTNHRGWEALMGAGNVILDPEGQPDPNGVGCVRHVLVAGLSLVSEEITRFDAPSRMEYRIVKGGGPIRAHKGEVLFTEQPDGTLVTWRCQFESSVPGMGPLIAGSVKQFFAFLLRRLDKQLSR
ncbi:MAG: SRPBCC family protein [Polyangia bacterium]|jgi:uncharacterized protein YndB with AHSA1/START domain